MVAKISPRSQDVHASAPILSVAWRADLLLSAQSTGWMSEERERNSQMTKSISRWVLCTAIATFIGMVSVVGSPLAAHAQTPRPGPGPAQPRPGQPRPDPGHPAHPIRPPSRPGHQAKQPVSPHIDVAQNDPTTVTVTGSGFTPGGQVDVWGTCYCSYDSYNGALRETVVTASPAGDISTTFDIGCAEGNFYAMAKDEATNTESNAPKTSVYGCL